MAGIYIHIPFCRTKCPYCNFFSLATRKYREEFYQALLKEIDLTRDYLGGEPVETIYFGGGTPSSLPVEWVGGILEKMRDVEAKRRSRPGVAGYEMRDLPLQEITMELNPDDVTPEFLEGLQAAGINRLSLGVQSFFDEDLQYLGRSHDARQAERALQWIRDTRCGIRDMDPETWDEKRKANSQKPKGKSQKPKAKSQNISIDLIYGIPTLTNERWKANLQRVIDLGIPHISAYALTVEPRTALAWMLSHQSTESPRHHGTTAPHHHGTTSPHHHTTTSPQHHLLPVSDDQAAEHFEILMEMMEQAGYIQYEISNFCLPGFESRHNSNYWKGVPYLGLGPSAHSYNGSSRQWNLSNLTTYIRHLATPRRGLHCATTSGIRTTEEEQLTPTQQYNEYVLTSLRTIWGVDIREISQRFGPAFETHFRHQAIRHMISGSLVEQSGIYTLTRTGKLLADGIAADLFMVE